MSTRVGQYLRHRPFLALALLLFSAMAALPTGLFLLFALITIVMSVVGFVFFEGMLHRSNSCFYIFYLAASSWWYYFCLVFLLFVGGMTLLSVLSGIALFSLLVSVIVTGVFVTIPNLLKRFYPQVTKVNGIDLQYLFNFFSHYNHNFTLLAAQKPCGRFRSGQIRQEVNLWQKTHTLNVLSIWWNMAELASWCGGGGHGWNSIQEDSETKPVRSCKRL